MEKKYLPNLKTVSSFFVEDLFFLFLAAIVFSFLKKDAVYGTISEYLLGSVAGIFAAKIIFILRDLTLSLRKAILTPTSIHITGLGNSGLVKFEDIHQVRLTELFYPLRRPDHILEIKTKKGSSLLYNSAVLTKLEERDFLKKIGENCLIEVERA